MRTNDKTPVVDGTLRTEENLIIPKPVRSLDRVARRRVRRALTLGTVATLTISAGSAFILAPALQAALPSCGGNQTAHPAPRNCTNTRVIDGTAFTVVLDVTAAGVATVTYVLDEPRAGDTPIRVRWHEGINSGPSAAEVSGVIPTGSTGPATLSLTALNCGGQIDMKAVFTDNGDSRGRVGGPLISIEACATTSTITPPSTATTVLSAPTSTTAAVTTSGAPISAPVVLAAEVTSQPAGRLPATGGNGTSPAAAGAVAFAIGAVLVLVTRRGLPFRNSK